jgi:hypothetical protein
MIETGRERSTPIGILTLNASMPPAEAPMPTIGNSATLTARAGEGQKQSA